MQMLCRLRRWLRGLEPRVRGHMDRPWLLRLQPWLEQRALFRFQRQPLARGVAAGMFCGLIPGPLQLPGTLLACAWLLPPACSHSRRYHAHNLPAAPAS